MVTSPDSDVIHDLLNPGLEDGPVLQRSTRRAYSRSFEVYLLASRAQRKLFVTHTGLSLRNWLERHVDESIGWIGGMYRQDVSVVQLMSFPNIDLYRKVSTFSLDTLERFDEIVNSIHVPPSSS